MSKQKLLETYRLGKHSKFKKHISTPITVDELLLINCEISAMYRVVPELKGGLMATSRHHGVGEAPGYVGMNATSLNVFRNLKTDNTL